MSTSGDGEKQKSVDIGTAIEKQLGYKGNCAHLILRVGVKPTDLPGACSNAGFSVDRCRARLPISQVGLGCRAEVPGRPARGSDTTARARRRPSLGLPATHTVPVPIPILGYIPLIHGSRRLGRQNVAGPAGLGPLGLVSGARGRSPRSRRVIQRSSCDGGIAHWCSYTLPRRYVRSS